MSTTVDGTVRKRTGDHQHQARQPAEDEAQALLGATFRTEDQDECRQPERLHGDPQGDKDEISDHTFTPSPLSVRPP
jgi:hypothetical protein